jgi:D-tagatose-1,6-bisphosphate aldolase subunit GatZ/KbaZ
VPVPGGAHEVLTTLTPTEPAAALATLQAHREALAALGLESVWPRIAALVVQPGVEFDHVRVIDYDREGTATLRHVLDDEPDMVFEAHSTDYQLAERLRELVEDHWAVLKVGPGLTFALREALFALAHIEEHLVPAGRRSTLIDVIEQRMLAAPASWSDYFDGDEDEQRVARRFSYSDRMRYYWPDPAILHAEARLYENLEELRIPLPLLSQYLPAQYLRVRHGELVPNPRELVIDKVRDALRAYSFACHHRAGGS